EIDGAFYGFDNWVPEYSTTAISGDISLIASLNQFKTNKNKTRKWNPYLFGGGGAASLTVNAINGDDEIDVLDLNFDDDWGITPYMHGGAGLGYLISDKISITIEHKLTKFFGRGNDLLDAVEFRGTNDDKQITGSSDLLNYTNLRLGFALGKKENRSIPLWWGSPLDMLAEDLAEVKSRPELDLTDTDEDGIIDMLDKEVNSDKDCPVDTRGVVLDSDGDGIADCKDKEPHSPPGYNVNGDGIAQVPKGPEPVTEEDVNRIVDAKIAAMPVADPSADWFLPMIHYSLDRHDIRNSEFGKLHNIATVMKLNPEIRVVATGHTDKLAGNCYNDLLSYNRANNAINYISTKYGIARDRFILNWGGENSTLVPSNGSNMMNRRVEFTVATTEAEMARPDCGVNRAGSGNTSGYSGNKEAGY
ncbi:MAG: OmpA family protein, partial [Bacteroidota bacterium]